MEHSARLEGIRAEIEAMARVAADTDLTAAVPACPGWDLAELLRHTGLSHRWVAQIVRTRATEMVQWREVGLDLPDDLGARVDWFAAGADLLVSDLAADPETPVWSYAPAGTIGWWGRRMLQETTVHRADVELALGLDPAIASDVACDGVEELLDVLYPVGGAGARVRALDRVGQSLHLHATDAPGEWTIMLTDEGFSWSTGYSKSTTAVRGQAADLLLLLWNRRAGNDGRFEVFGDADLLAAWTETTAP